MTSEELWREVGRFLRDRREAQGKKWTHIAGEADIDPDTVKAIERGQPGQVEKLERLVQALGFSTVDVLNDVLKGAEAQPTLEAAALLRAFDRLGVEDRGLLLLFAKRMVEQHEARTLAETRGPVAVPPPTATRGRTRKGPPPR